MRIWMTGNDYEQWKANAAGYKDGASYQLGVPAITIETDAENGNSLVNPVPINRFNEIWKRNKNVVYATACSLQ